MTDTLDLSNIDLFRDPYYTEEYSRLYLQNDDTLFSFEYRDKSDIFKTISIKKAIREIGSQKIDDGWFDLETTYGYGGYISTSSDKSFLEKALTAYNRRCKEEKIVAEFIRFHPFNPNLFHLKENFDLFIEDRATVAVRCTKDKEERWSNYSSKVRRKLRKCGEKLKFEESDDLPTFYNLYRSTMERNRASNFYYFSKDYFEKMQLLPFCRLYAVKEKESEEIVSMAFVLFGRDVAHIHLSANRTEKMKLNGNYFLFDNIFEEASRKGCRYTFMGGGRTNSPDDTLLRFKRQFSDISLPFCIAGKVFEKEVYGHYNEIWDKEFPSIEVNYFLKYRLKGEHLG